MAYKPCSNERRQIAVSLRTRHRLVHSRTAGGPPDLERPEEWERQGLGGSLGLFFVEMHSSASRERSERSSRFPLRTERPAPVARNRRWLSGPYSWSRRPKPTRLLFGT